MLMECCWNATQLLANVTGVLLDPVRKFQEGEGKSLPELTSVLNMGRALECFHALL